jgi:hypothetical protein
MPFPRDIREKGSHQLVRIETTPQTGVSVEEGRAEKSGAFSAFPWRRIF